MELLARRWPAGREPGDRPSAARAATAPTPKRSVFIYIPNGVNTLDYQITTPGKDFEFSRTLKPLEKLRDFVTPISGLHHPGGLGHHHNCQKIWLTGGKLGPSDRNTISVDQQMAEVTAPHTRFHSLEIANKGESLGWTADGIRLPGMSRCRQIFAHLFLLAAFRSDLTEYRSNLRLSLCLNHFR